MKEWLKTLTAKSGNRMWAVGGFSLIELLAAMAILSIIVILMTVIFTESDRSWTIGTERVDNTVGGRAAVSLIAHDMQYAVADDILSFSMTKDRKGMISYGFENREIAFVSLQHDSSGGAPRTAREIHYWVRETEGATNRYELVRGYYSETIVTDRENHSYWNRDWFQDHAAGRPTGVLVAENVAALCFYAPRGESVFPEGRRLPGYMDVYLEVIDKRFAVRLGKTTDEAKRKELVELKSRRYTGRTYFQNRDGYSLRHMSNNVLCKVQADY